MFDQLHDPLLACSGRVKLAPHLDEPAINLPEALIDVTAEIDEVLSKSVETRRRGVTKITKLGADLGDVAVGRTGEDPRCLVLPHSEKSTAGLRFSVDPG